MPPKTVIEKLQSPSTEVTVFKISGTLGFHEKDTLEKLFSECEKRQMNRIVFDVSELTSLGGGCAKIIREAVVSGRVVVGMAGAKSVVLKFLQKDTDLDGLIASGSTQEAIDSALELGVPSSAGTDEPLVTESDDELVSDESLAAVLLREDEECEEAIEILREADVDITTETPVVDEPAADAPPEPVADPAPVVKSETVSQESSDAPEQSRELKKRLVQNNVLLSISSEFARMHDQKSLLDAFLLTTIAQVGVESAVFLESNRHYFVPSTSKGIEAEELRGFALPEEHFRLDKWLQTKEVYTIEASPFADDAKAPLLSLGCSYVVPFIVQSKIVGIILLGKPIKRAMDEPTTEFLKSLVDQAAIAYENLSRFEEENERTLGLVQTLIGLIEENTLEHSSTQMVSGYVHAIALRLCYDEDIRDLMYGTMLRDIGMIKVSELIVRSPRELLPEEWEIIKRHPLDGADMLQNMKFGETAVEVVRAHHERFNGEGYPRGLHGQDIPLGARIISVVESYSAMLQERATRPALSPEEALDTIKENWGMRYDPDVVKHFVEMIEEELRSGETGSERKFELFRSQV